MCGRAYQTYTEEELYARYLNQKAKRDPLNLELNFNLSPSQTSPVVLHQEGKPAIRVFRWGLVPLWAKDVKIGFKMINARAETVAEKPAFRKALVNRRCLVPLSGFYEWRRDGDVKRPFAIQSKDRSILSAAGLWESWKDPEKGQPLHTFTIITTGANTFMNEVHDRMPVFLTPAAEKTWLDESEEDPARLTRLLKPYPDDALEMYEVSTLVNSPRNNRAELLAPVHDPRVMTKL